MLGAPPPVGYHLYFLIQPSRSRTFASSTLPPPSTGAPHLRRMPCLRTETVHGVVCKFYEDGGIVKVGTTAACRFTIKDSRWRPTRSAGFQRGCGQTAELITRELAMADELPVDEDGEAAMAAKAAATAKEAERRSA